jgi:hydrogenase maturation protease
LPHELAVACLGNQILGDDAFGLLVAKELEGLEGADLLTLQEGGLDIAIKLAPYTRVLVVDALETTRGKVGEVLRLSVRKLASIRGLGGHAMSLAQGLEALRLVSGKGPRSVEILVCRIMPVEAYSDKTSPAVRKAAQLCTRIARDWVSCGGRFPPEGTVAKRLTSAQHSLSV